MSHYDYEPSPMQVAEAEKRIAEAKRVKELGFKPHYIRGEYVQYDKYFHECIFCSSLVADPDLHRTKCTDA